MPCGSYSGYGTARDLAKLMGILANGGSYNGKSYMSPEIVRLLTEVLTDRSDEVLPWPQVYGRGTTPLLSPLVSRYNFLTGMGIIPRGMPTIHILKKIETRKHFSRMRTIHLPTAPVLVAATRCQYLWGYNPPGFLPHWIPTVFRRDPRP